MSTTTLPTALTAGTWAIDPSHTEASFTVRHAGISKVRGTVAVTSGTITVAGDLTINGVTKTVELATEFGGAATDPFGNQRAGFSASVTVSRKEFGITWNAALEAGGVLVSDKVVINLEVSAIKQA